MTLSLIDSSPQAWMHLKQDIIDAAPRLGIDKIRFASAEAFLSLKEILIEHRRKGYESGFEEPDIDKRVFPERIFDQPRSIISIAVAYPSKLPHPPQSVKGAYRGVISRSAWGEDYHRVLRNRLQQLEAFISAKVTNARMLSMVDTGALVDRAVAERAGMGWVGKNCAVITPEWGSWVYLGEMITNLPFPVDTPIWDECGECTICIDACPTGALVGPKQLNAQLCISYLTQTKRLIEDEMKAKIGNRLYGCDTCQVVCPKNKSLNWTHQQEFQPEAELVKPLLIPLLQLTNQQFKAKYGKSAASWRGKTPIQRNAIISLGHFKDQSAIPILKQLLLSDSRVVMRATAAWALGQMRSEDANDGIEAALKIETEMQVILELHKAQAQLVQTKGNPS